MWRPRLRARLPAPDYLGGPLGPARWLLATCTLLLLATPVLAAPRVELELVPRDEVALDELAVLRVRIEGAGNLSRSVPTFQLENMEVVSGPSQSTSLSIINGSTTSSVILSWHLRPLVLGKARVYGARIQLGGEVVDLPNRRIQVTEATGRVRSQRGNDPLGRFFSDDPFFSDPFGNRRRRRRERRPAPPPEVFLVAEATPEKPWVGQQVTYTLYLYTQVNVRSVNPDELPSFKGFWSEVIPQPEELQPQMVRRDGKEFGKVVLLQRALFPRRAGSLEIEPVIANLEASLPDSRPFGSLLPRVQRIQRESNALRLEVRELPEAPEGFVGAVGDLDLEATLDPLDVEVGEASTLTLSLRGRGHLQGLGAPELPEMPGIQIFPPQQQSEGGLRGKNITGERTWSFVLVPEKPGQWQLPAIEVPYFDPRRGEYRYATSDPFELSVRGSTRASQESGSTVELHSIRTAALPAVRGTSWHRILPWLLALPWGAGLLLLGWRRGPAGSHRLDRKRLLDHLRQAAQESRPRQAAAGIEEAWRDYLEHRYGIHPGTASTQWGRQLAEQGVSSACADALVELADDLHYLRYAPKLSSTDELRAELVERSGKILKGLGK